MPILSVLGRRKLWIPLLAFCVALAAGELLVQANRALLDSGRVATTRQLLNVHATNIERDLAFALASTYILAQEVIRGDGQIEDFDGSARSILSQLPGVSNLQLAPDGVIERVYPLAGNEAAIGHDILTDDKRRTEAQAAVASGKLTLAGPFDLIQGGTGIVGRHPVFLNHDGRRDFWGFVSALILLDTLIEAADIRALVHHGHAYEIGRVDPESGETRIFRRSEYALPDDVVSVDIMVPNGAWFLRAGSIEPVSGLGVIVGRLLSVSFALLLAAFSIRVIREPETLRSEVASKTAELEVLAFRDALTSLPNRLSFTRTMRKLIEEARDGRASMHLMVLDVDHFKEVNDVLGHEMGDELLIEAARRMLACLPSCARLHRLGGDEFTIILSNRFGTERDATWSDQDIEAVAACVVDEFARSFQLGDDVAHVSASIGIVAYGDTGNNVKDMLRAADNAMYEAKRLGRSRFCRFTASMKKNAEHVARLGTDLRSAIANRELELVYQPIICARTGRITKAEALLRWHHPTLGPVSPFEFIPIAEQTGTIVAIGEWVFQHAAETAHEWRRKGFDDFQVSINISPVQLRSEPHVQALIETARTIGLAADSLLLEITEGIFLHNSNDVRAHLVLLRNEGMQLALDDFGTGYSSLSYLKSFEIDYLKIDRSFIASLVEQGSERVLCQAMFSIAAKLGLKTVAEGVETDEQKALLQTDGCDFIQGYLVSRPLNAIDLERMLVAQRDTLDNVGIETFRKSA